MIRVFIYLMNILVFALINLLMQTDVSLQMNIPSEVTAGQEMEVRITLNKGNVEGFSRFLQQIPAGLTAESYLSSNADFTFKDQRVRFIWLKLPDKDAFQVAYKIKVDERLKGTFTLDGKFSYIENNERKSVAITSNPVTIIPSPYIDPELIVDINDFESKVIQKITPAITEPQIACIRQTPYLSSLGNEYIVNILVKKDDKEKFAKIEELIPTGYTAVDIERKDAIFTFKEGNAKFLWMNLPANPYFFVSYRLIPDHEISTVPSIEGKFSYLENDKTMIIDIMEDRSGLKNLTAMEISELIQRLAAKEPRLVTKVEESPVTKTPVTKKTSEEKSKYKEPKANMPYILEPEEGIYYRVQIAAGHQPVLIKKYFKDFEFKKDIRKEYHEGWHKYSIGSFGVYKEARDYRVYIWNNTDIDDAFVSAYNNGTRITVQEALMIANQKWYR